MKAAYYEQYGNEDSLQLIDIACPTLQKNEVLLDVHATSINASDWEFLSGTPAYARINGLRKPSKHVLGSDISGTVLEVGSDVTKFKIGDSVFCDNFDRFGGFAEQVAVPEAKIIMKPTALNHITASAIPQSGVIALQALRKYGALEAGQKVLINGAGGGAGSFAIQMAKSAGAHVTAVDHRNKLAFVQKIGADVAWDYQTNDITHSGLKFDKIIDFVGHHTVFDFRRILAAQGTYVIVGGLLRDILGTVIFGGLSSAFTMKKMSVLLHQQNEDDIVHIANLIQDEKIIGCIDKTFSLDNIQQAFQSFRKQEVLGKVVITMKAQ